MGWVHLVLILILSLPALAAEKRKVVTTFLPAYSFAANIAGDLADVENLLPGNVSLHDYQLSPGEIRKLNRADLIIINGLGMEAFLDRALANAAKGTSGKIVRLSDGLDAELIRAEPSHDHDHAEDHEHPHHHGDVNPHIWLDPILAAHGVTNILKGLQKLDPAQSSAYEKNAELYVARLHRLDQELIGMLQQVKSVPFITYHDAFPYFVKRYGLNLVGVVESVPEVSPSAREMSNLLRTIRESKAKALFTEPQESARLARQIAKDTRIKLGELDPLETGIIEPESYEDGMRRNARELVETLR